MGALPRRPTVFHFRNDQDSSSPSDSDDDSDHNSSRHHHKLKHRHISSFNTVSPRPNNPYHPHLKPVPRVTRTNSSPILLSNGKPLKSSLKSSHSTPTIQSPTAESGPSLPSPSSNFHARHRASSTPNTAACEHPTTPKNVHFPSTGSDLATVRFYSRSARPASISLPIDVIDTETETESERTPGLGAFPFPRLPTPRKSRMSGERKGEKDKKTVLDLDPLLSSPIPAHTPPAHSNVHLEALTLHSTSPSTSSSTPSNPHLALKGTLIVRNLAYEKTVAVRFTLDDWDTTSEVSAYYVASLPSLPPSIYVPGSGLIPSSSSDALDLSPLSSPSGMTPTWDRFAFTIRLDDYAPSLASRTLWLVARFGTPAAKVVLAAGGGLGEPRAMVQMGGGGVGGSATGNEWWDNNGGRNYKVAFFVREVEESGSSSESGSGVETVEKKREVLVAPPPPPQRTFPTPPPPPPINITAASPPASFQFQHPHPALSRLRSLSLKNYAAPVVSPTSQSHSTHPFPSLSPLQSPVQSHSQPPHTPYDHAERERTPSLSESSVEGSPSLTTPTDLVAPPIPSMEMVGGFPATTFGLGLGIEDNNAESVKESVPPRAGTISLYWPWARTTAVPAMHMPVHEEAAELSSDADAPHSHPASAIPRALSPQAAQHTIRSPSPQLSDSSSGSGSSGEGVRKPKLGRRVFHPSSPPMRHDSPVSIAMTAQGIRSLSSTPTPASFHASPSSSSSTTPTPSQSQQQDRDQAQSPLGRVSTPPRGPDAQNGGDSAMEADKVYQALVRKWCFAAAPATVVR
ncbi:hypothetical protein C0991_006317 [Blastosporella zonata]|nr:hypothetical protein C0991_006317 [Blastosporella zonata]